jgi:glycosyltransferase involved in cell wall biosynthesis
MSNSISVIIPLYNGEKYIKQTLESVFRQTLTPLEIIVVNDGSSDNSPNLVESLKAQSPCPLLLINQANAGTQAARNSGIQQASGTYVALLDQDDWWDETFLAETSNLIDSNKVVYTSYQNVNEAGKLIGKIVHPNPHHFGFPRLMLGNQVFPSLILLPKAKLLEVGLFDPTFLASGDWDMWIRLQLNGVQFIPLKKKLVNYRLHPENTSKNQRLMINDHRAVIAKTLAYPDLPRRLLRFQDRILASDHLYAATRFWRMYATNPSDTLKTEMRQELKKAFALNPDSDFLAVILGAMASNSTGKPVEAINFTVETLEKALTTKDRQKLTALANLVLFRHTKKLHYILPIGKNLSLLIPFLLKSIRRKLKNTVWIEKEE